LTEIRELMMMLGKRKLKLEKSRPQTFLEKWTLSSASCTFPGILVGGDEANPSS
jgi:hypothetical protein